MKIFPLFYANFLMLLALAPHEIAHDLLLNEVIPYNARSNLLIDFDWDVPVRVPDAKMLGHLNKMIVDVFQNSYGLADRYVKFKFLTNNYTTVLSAYVSII